MTSQIGPDIVQLLFATLLSLACLAWGLRALHKKRIIDDTPTLKAIGVFIGLAELKGTAELQKPLTSYLTETKCVHYRWRIEERWRKHVTETYTDSNGKTRTRTKVKTGWKTVDNGGESSLFYLKDETGSIRIDPSNADIQGETVLHETVNRSHPLYYGKGPKRGILHSTHRRRFTETLIPQHAPLYIIGQARERSDIVAAEIAYDEEEPLYVISTEGEKAVSAGFGNGFTLVYMLGLLLSMIPLVYLQDFIAPILFVPLTIYLFSTCLGWFMIVYNSLVSLGNSVQQAWSLIDIQLKRRSDLIPSLVEVIEGYSEHEKTIQTEVAKLRAQIGSTTDAEGVTSLITGIAEAYPDLNAGDQYLHLQQSLEETEQRIAHARDYYNQIANFFNTRIEKIPELYIANLAGLKPKPFWKGENFNRGNDGPVFDDSGQETAST